MEIIGTRRDSRISGVSHFPPYRPECLLTSIVISFSHETSPFDEYFSCHETSHVPVLTYTITSYAFASSRKIHYPPRLVIITYSRNFPYTLLTYTIGGMNSPSIFWYDFETFGADPRRDRASQFAGIRTDEELNIVGEPLVMYCRPADDFLPGPVACRITGITPQLAAEKGLCEAEFISRIHDEFSQPKTCVAGYNNIRFDDELTRQLLYRNFFDPYEREWKNGNSRWDIIDMVRLCAATRPEGIDWPKKEDGSNSFRLDRLTIANGIKHGHAHDALADVHATIEMARLIRGRQPKLYEYVYGIRDKRKVQQEIDLTTRKPVLHVSVMYPSRRGCLALVMPLCVHPANTNGIIVYDLRENPENWMDLPIEEIRDRVFTPSQQLSEDRTRIPLKAIHINKCPIVTSPAVLSPERAAEYEIDLEACRRHWEILQADERVLRKISEIYRDEAHAAEQDPDFMIYSGGFFADSDRRLMETARSTRPSDLGRLDLPFRDKRLPEMLFRYRARNYPDTLNADEQQRWEEFRLQRLQDPAAVERFAKEMSEAREEADVETMTVLEDLQTYVDEL